MIYSTNNIDPDYCNDLKFSIRYAWANSADPDQTAPTVCYCVCIVWTHYSTVESRSSNFRGIITNCLGVRIFRKFTDAQADLSLRWSHTICVSELGLLFVKILLMTL